MKISLKSNAKNSLKKINESFFDWKYDNLKKYTLSIQNMDTIRVLALFENLYSMKIIRGNHKTLEAYEWHQKILLSILKPIEWNNIKTIEKLGTFLYSLIDFFEDISSQFYATFLLVEDALRNTLIKIFELEPVIESLILTNNIYLHKDKTPLFEKVTFRKLIELYRFVELRNPYQTKEMILLRNLKTWKEPIVKQATLIEYTNIHAFLIDVNNYRDFFFHPGSIKYPDVFLEKYFSWLVEYESFLIVEDAHVQRLFNKFLEKGEGLILDSFTNKINDIWKNQRSKPSQFNIIVKLKPHPPLSDERELAVIDEFQKFIKPLTLAFWDFVLLRVVVDRIEKKAEDLVKFISYYDNVNIRPKNLTGVVKILKKELKEREPFSIQTLFLIQQLYLLFGNYSLLENYEITNDQITNVIKYLRIIHKVRNHFNHFNPTSKTQMRDFYEAINFLDIKGTSGSKLKKDVENKKIELDVPTRS